MTAPALPELAQAIEHARLPALIERARNRLAEAMSSAEVLEAKALAEAALHYAKLTKAANETQADCLRMIVRAEMRMADEIDRGQANGELALARDGRPESVRAPDTSAPLTYEALGIDRRRVAEWREIRDAGDEAVEQAIQGALSAGRAPTKTDIRNYSLRVMGSSESVEWYTPPHIVELATKALGEIDLDPSWHPESPVRARTTYTAEDDGLAQFWSGRVWLNPPYGRTIDRWVSKLVVEFNEGRVSEALALIPARVDTEWFRRIDPFPRCYVYGRLRFSNSENSAPFPCCIPYLGPNIERFAEVFGEIGGIWVRLGDAA